jgi:hypothetical protein
MGGYMAPLLVAEANLRRVTGSSCSGRRLCVARKRALTMAGAGAGARVVVCRSSSSGVFRKAQDARRVAICIRRRGKSPLHTEEVGSVFFFFFFPHFFGFIF